MEKEFEQILSQAYSLQNLLKPLLNFTVHQVKAKESSIFIIDNEEGILEIFISSPQKGFRDFSIPFDQPLTPTDEREEVKKDSVSLEKREKIESEEQDNTSLSLPLKVDETVIGMLHLKKDTHRQFSQQDMDLLGRHLMEVANTLEKTRQNEIEARRVSMLFEQISSFSTLAKLLQKKWDLPTVLEHLLSSLNTVMQSDLSYIALPNKKGQLEMYASFGMESKDQFSMFPYSLESQLAQKCYTQGQMLIVNSENEPSGQMLNRDLENTPLIYMPLEFNHNIIGVMAVLEKRKGLFNTNWFYNFMESIAPMAAMFICFNRNSE